MFLWGRYRRQVVNRQVELTDDCVITNFIIANDTMRAVLALVRPGGYVRQRSTLGINATKILLVVALESNLKQVHMILFILALEK